MKNSKIKKQARKTDTERLNSDDGVTRIDTDVLILGSGLAGLLLSILLEERGAAVTVASKEKFSESNTFYAQGGLAAVTASLKASSSDLDDSTHDHLLDTIKSGAGLTDWMIARKIIEAAPHLVQELNRLGMIFDTTSVGDFELAREGGHSQARVLHSKDATGRAIENTLLGRARAAECANPDYKMLEYCFAYNLIVIDGQVVGADVLHDGLRKRIFAKAVVLATGGAGQIFSRTTNPLVATADGIALAYRAGATLADLEFVQFHPTALAVPGAPAYLISEAVRGAGAVLLNGSDQRFMRQFHPDGELATRDVVARAIHQTMLANGLAAVKLDLRPIGEKALLKRFPNIIDSCRRYGIDPLVEPVPVCPAAHYFMGGVLSDEWGRTTLPNLFAIGEVACTGLHGANRLASNSLLEAGVMAMNLARLLSSSVSGQSALPRLDAAHSSDPVVGHDNLVTVPSSTARFKVDMYENASLVRSQTGLQGLAKRLTENQSESAPLTVANMCSANMHLVARLMVAAALNRTESRGSHYRDDFPDTDDMKFASRQTLHGDSWSFSAAQTTQPVHAALATQPLQTAQAKQAIQHDARSAKIDKQSSSTQCA